MNGEDLYNGITDIRDSQIEEARQPEGAGEPDEIGRQEKAVRRRAVPGRRRLGWVLSTAAVLAVVLVATTALGPGGGAASAYAISEAVYPDQAVYSEENFDDWWDMRDARMKNFDVYAGTLTGFMEKALPVLLEGAETENRVCSPANVYMALSMLAELTDGNSRAQILDLLGCDSVETVRTRARALWNGNYIDDGTVTSLLANSLWLNDGLSFVQSTMDTLADTYYADSFRGEMGSPAFDEALQDWTDGHTGGRLSEFTKALKLDPNTVLALVSTIYFRARWSQEFNPQNTSSQTFHAIAEDLDTDFMHQTINGYYYWGSRFTAITKNLENAGEIWLFLPDEGVNPATLLTDEEVLSVLEDAGNYDALAARNDRTYIDEIHLSMPKFDVSCQTDLGESLQALGVTDVFDPDAADFSPMLDAETLAALQPYVSQAKHAARVTVDEEGLEAAAFVEIDAAGAGGPPEDIKEIDFVLDRPFFFAVTGEDGTLLFAGVVNQP